MRYIAESTIHVSVRVDDTITVSDVSKLTDEEIVRLFNVVFTIVKDKLGNLLQYTMMNDKIISDRGITSLSETSHIVTCSFHWEKEYELGDEINNFRSVELHLTNKIREDIKKLDSDKRFEWVYPAINNVRFYCDKPHVTVEGETKNEE